MGKNDEVNALACVDQYLTEIRMSKTAALKKKATDPTDPTTQPVMKAPDGTVKATTGSRAAENDSDVKKDYGDAGNTGQEDANSASSEHPSDSIGTQKMDASQTKGNVQTPKATLSKPTKADGDGGESPNHPSNATFSEKYSSLLTKGNNFLSKMASLTEKKVAAPATEAAAAKEGNPVPTQAPKAAAATKPDGDEKKLAAAKYPDEAEAGYVAAALLAEELGFTKRAAPEVNPATQEQAERLVKFAFQLADDYCDLLDGLEKKSEEMPVPAERKFPAAPYKPKSKNQAKEELGKKANEGFPGGDPSGAGMIPPEAMAGDMAGMGGGAGGPPPGPEGGMAHPGGDEEAVIEQLAQALQQAGITPEQLAEAVAAEQGGGGGDMGGGGGMPPEAGGGAGGPPPAGPIPDLGGGGGGGGGAPEQGEEEASSGKDEENAGEGPSKSKDEGASEEKPKEKEKEASARTIGTKLAALIRNRK